VIEALQGLAWQPTTVLGYANHLHDNDRWPMGDAGAGIALPPLFDDTLELRPCSLPLSLAQQRDKAMALGMMHDLQPAPPFKRRVRRWLQRVLAGVRRRPTVRTSFSARPYDGMSCSGICERESHESFVSGAEGTARHSGSPVRRRRGALRVRYPLVEQ
jgi:hypothetical protein